jgi:hypothetical protein
MSAPEATAVITPPAPAPVAPPAPPAVTVEHISALHRHLDELGHFVKAEFEKVIAFVSKAAPVAQVAAAAIETAVPSLGAAAAVVAKIAGELGCCAHLARQHNPDGTCQVCAACKGNAPAA